MSGRDSKSSHRDQAKRRLYIVLAIAIAAFASGFLVTQYQYATLPLEDIASGVTNILVPLYYSILILVVPADIVRVHKGSRGTIVNVPGWHGVAPKDIALMSILGSVLAGIIFWQVIYAIAPIALLNLGRFMMLALYGSVVIYLPLLSKAVYGNFRLPYYIKALIVMFVLIAAGSATASLYPI